MEFLIISFSLFVCSGRFGLGQIRKRAVSQLQSFRLRLSAVQTQELKPEDCNLIRSEFLHTPLHGVDFTACAIDGLLLSGKELRGTLVTPGAGLRPCPVIGTDYAVTEKYEKKERFFRSFCVSALAGFPNVLPFGKRKPARYAREIKSLSKEHHHSGIMTSVQAVKKAEER